MNTAPDWLLAASSVGIAALLAWALVKIGRQPGGWISWLPPANSTRKGRRWLTYGAYGLIILSFLVFPLVAFASLMTWMLATEERFRKATPLIRSTHVSVNISGWALWIVVCVLLLAYAVGTVVLLISTGTWIGASPVVDLLLIGYTQLFLGAVVGAAGVIVAAWNLARRDWDRSLITRYALLGAVPPIGIAQLKLSSGDTSSRMALWGLAVAVWSSALILLTPLVVGSLIAQTLQIADWANLVAEYISTFLVFALVAMAMYRGFERATQNVPDPGLERFPGRPQLWLTRLHGRERMWLAIDWLAILVTWLVILGAVAFVWTRVEFNEVGSRDMSHLAGVSPVARLVALALVALPTTALSAWMLWRAFLSQGSRSASWSSSTAVRGLASVLLVPIATVTAGSLLEAYHEPERAILIEGLGIGVSTGLSLGLINRLHLNSRVAEVSCQVVATLFCLLLIYYLTFGSAAVTATSATLPPFSTWIVTSTAGVLGLVAGLFFGARVLVPGFIRFGETAGYFEEIFWPYIGYAAGYFLIILAFAVGYYAQYNVGQESNRCSSPQPMYTKTYGSDVSLCELTFKDFAFYSVNTIAPLGYSELRPNTDELRFASVVELSIGVFWTVIVFAGIIVNVTDKHTKQIVSEAIRAVPGVRFPID